MLGMETNTSELLNEMITSVKNYGRCGVTGVYVGPNGVVCGVDFSKGMLAELKEKKKTAARPEFKNILTDVHDITDLASSQFEQTLAYKFGSFDLITCFGCLNLLPN
jgi:ubiquinone/menaquinone biosynthesis C-methylase UbiE